MGRVEIDRRVNGQSIERVIAHTAEAIAGVEKATAEHAARAVAILEAHRYKGYSKISVERDEERPVTDRLIVLNDEHPDASAYNQDFKALTIEFGRKGYYRDGTYISPAEAVAPLRRSVGLPLRG